MDGWLLLRERSSQSHSLPARRSGTCNECVSSLPMLRLLLARTAKLSLPMALFSAQDSLALTLRCAVLAWEEERALTGTKTMEFVKEEGENGRIRGETRQCIKNLECVLKEAGSSLAKVVKVTILLDNIDVSLSSLP